MLAALQRPHTVPGLAVTSRSFATAWTLQFSILRHKGADIVLCSLSDCVFLCKRAPQALTPGLGFSAIQDVEQTPERCAIASTAICASN